MMPLRIRRKGRVLEKLEIATALQRRKKSFQHDRTIRITLASGRDRFATIGSEFNGCDIKRRIGFGAPRIVRLHGLAEMAACGLVDSKIAS